MANLSIIIFPIVQKISYKKIDEWYIEWQRVVHRVTTSGTTSDNEWQWVL